MFCEESLGMVKVRAFPKCVCPPLILLLESVDYFGTSTVNTTEWLKQNKNLN